MSQYRACMPGKSYEQYIYMSIQLDKQQTGSVTTGDRFECPEPNHAEIRCPWDIDTNSDPVSERPYPIPI